MLREDNEGPAASAFQALAKSIEDETISFEGQVYGKPFFPRNEQESRSLFQWLCADIERGLVDGQTLRHYSWMSSGKDTTECYHFSGDANHAGVSGARARAEKEYRGAPTYKEPELVRHSNFICVEEGSSDESLV